MQDAPRNRKPGEEGESPDSPTPSTRRKHWQDVLNEQLRALYESYRADDVPTELLDLAARIEEAQRQSRGEAGTPHNGSHEEAPEAKPKE
ncbi:MAG: hypothetical protein BroJett029_06470 [Alphaproteobacteria bacterium]|nr:MAG: hypothetical protein BroJett029_06470 [Alphaproteobacteria bacterium]